MSRATVCAGGVITSYARAGRGKPIIVVSADIDATDVQELITTLARDHLVFAAAPELTDRYGLGAWLRGFTEGLGITEAHLILHASLAAGYRWIS